MHSGEIKSVHCYGGFHFDRFSLYIKEWLFHLEILLGGYSQMFMHISCPSSIWIQLLECFGHVKIYSNHVLYAFKKYLHVIKEAMAASPDQIK